MSPRRYSKGKSGGQGEAAWRQVAKEQKEGEGKEKTLGVYEQTYTHKLIYCLNKPKCFLQDVKCQALHHSETNHAVQREPDKQPNKRIIDL